MSLGSLILCLIVVALLLAGLFYSCLVVGSRDDDRWGRS